MWPIVSLYYIIVLLYYNIILSNTTRDAWTGKAGGAVATPAFC